MLIKLFLTFLKIGILSFGGGYAVVSLIQDEIVNNQKIISLEQFIDLVALSQISPGPLAVNASTFVGLKTFGLFGATATTFAIFILPFFLSYIISKLYNNNAENRLLKNIIQKIRLCVSPIILIATIKLFKISITDYKSYIIIAIISIIFLFNKKISPIAIIVIGGILGYIFYGILI